MAHLSLPNWKPFLASSVRRRKFKVFHEDSVAWCEFAFVMFSGQVKNSLKFFKIR